MNPPEPDADRDLAAVLADLEEIPAGADLDALATAGAFDDARQHYAQAEQLAVEISNVERQLSVLNNLAYTEYEANEPDRAWAAVQRLREVSAQHGRAPDIKMLDSIARIEIS